MSSNTDYWVKGSSNKITLILKEAGVAITNDIQEVRIVILDDDETELLVIARAGGGPFGSGITYTDASGTLEIVPGNLSEDDSVLVDDNLYRMVVTVYDSSNQEGVVYGEEDSGNTQYIIARPDHTDPKPT